MDSALVCVLIDGNHRLRKLAALGVPDAQVYLLSRELTEGVIALGPDGPRSGLGLMIQRLGEADAGRVTQGPAWEDGTVKLDVRETATVLAALRQWQQILLGSEPEGEWMEDIASAGGTVTPLTLEEIDGLCLKLNVGGPANPAEGVR